jgi:hypothetical protein
MPNSGIAIRTSIVYWQEGQNFDPWTWVDIAAPLRFADYAAGRDPALDAALKYTPPTPLSKILYEAARARGDLGVNAAIRTFLANPKNRYVEAAFVLPSAAEQVMLDGHGPEALLAANAVTDVVPKSVDAWLVLASVALQTNRKDIAKAAAERAMMLDPNQRVARSLLEQAKR